MAEKKLTIQDFEIISVRDLAYKIKEVDDYIANPKTEEARAERKPNLAFFLGAGASKDSGVILAGEMMKMFKDKIFEIHCDELKTDKEKGKWLKAQGWYKDGKKEYGCLFEKFRDTRRGRQRFVEEICHKNPLTGKLVEPSFGYVVLADLLLRNYINTVVTTNFDDLVYIASTTFTGSRPIVYAYGILASEMKISDSHSKVLKLHGDFLYSNIVNTDNEMTAKSDAIINPVKDAREIISHLNMERQVRTVMDNFGLIVAGYAGGDETIMKLLKQVSENNGFYWCYIKDYPPDADVLKLVQTKNGKLVEITGFDDMMKEISDITDFSIDDLLESFERRKENLVERIAKFNEDYTKKSLGEYADELTEKQKDNLSETLSASDYTVLANRASNENNFAQAEKHYLKAIELNPTNSSAYINLGYLYAGKLSRPKKAEELLHKAIQLDPNNAAAYNNLGYLFVNKFNKFEEAENTYRKAIQLDSSNAVVHNNLGYLLYRLGKIDEAINELQTSIRLKENYINPRLQLASIYKHLGKQNKLDEFITQLKTLIKDDDNYNLAHLNAIINNKEMALKNLKIAIEKDSSLKFPSKKSLALEWLYDDERFWEIVGRDKEE